MIPMQPREQMVINQMTPERAASSTTSRLGEYDVVIATAPARDSFDEVQFAEALNLRQVGVAIPDDAIIEYSHLAKKGELAKRIRMMTGVEQTPEQQQMMAAVQQQMAMQNPAAWRSPSSRPKYASFSQKLPSTSRRYKTPPRYSHSFA